MAPSFLGTLPAWITAASTTTGVAAIIIAYFRRGVSLKGLQYADHADIRDHYAKEVEALRAKLDRQEEHFQGLEKHLREMLAASDKRADESDRRHEECEKARGEMRREVDGLHAQISGIHRQVGEQSADKLLILEGAGRISNVAPHSVAAAKRVRKNRK